MSLLFRRAAAGGSAGDQIAGQAPTQLEGIGDAQHGAAGVLGEPVLGGYGGGEGVHLVAERRPHTRRAVVGDQDRHHRGRRLASTVTPATGSTDRVTCSPLPGVGETTCAGRSRTVGKIRPDSCHFW